MELDKQFFSKLKEDYSIVNSLFQEKRKPVRYGIFALLVIPPLIIVLFQNLIVYIIPPDITLQYIFLNLTHPNPSTMFFSNYMHNPAIASHLLNNYWGYFVSMGIVFTLYYVVIPLGQYKNKLTKNYPDAPFLATNLVFLLFLPFAISGISILFGRWMGITGVAGFSGIVYAIYAYIFFLILKITFDLVLSRQQQNSRPFSSVIDMMLFVTIFAILLPIFAIFLEMSSHQVNIFGHFAGYSLGLFISASVAITYETDESRLKIFSSSILFMALLFSTLCWLIVT